MAPVVMPEHYFEEPVPARRDSLVFHLNTRLEMLQRNADQATDEWGTAYWGGQVDACEAILQWLTGKIS